MGDMALEYQDFNEVKRSIRLKHKSDIECLLKRLDIDYSVVNQETSHIRIHLKNDYIDIFLTTCKYKYKNQHKYQAGFKGLKNLLNKARR